MNIKRLIQSIVATAALLSARAEEPIRDPEVDFINTPEEVRANWGILPEPGIKRLDLDLTGNGHATIFLAYNGVCSKGGTGWTAYHPTGVGYVRTYGIQFREDFVRAGKIEGFTPDGGLMLVYPGKGGGVLCRTSVGSTGKLTTQEVMDLDYSNPDHQKLFERVIGRKLDEPMPDEFFRNPPHQVIDVKSIEARAASKSGMGTGDDTGGSTPTLNASSVVQSPVPKKDPATVQESAVGEDSASGMLWTVVVVLIGAAVGLGWWLVKRRSWPG